MGSICLVSYKPSSKGSRALDTWRNDPDELWAVAVLVPKAAGLEIYWLNRIQQLEWRALQIERYLFKNNWFAFATLMDGLTSPAHPSHGRWRLMMAWVTGDHTLQRGLALFPHCLLLDVTFPFYCFATIRKISQSAQAAWIHHSVTTKNPRLPLSYPLLACENPTKLSGLLPSQLPPA